MPNLDVLGLVDGLVANHLASKASRWAGGLAVSPWKGPHITGPVRQMTPCIWIHKTNEPLGYLKSMHQHSQNRQSKGVVAVRVCVCASQSSRCDGLLYIYILLYTPNACNHGHAYVCVCDYICMLHNYMQMHVGAHMIICNCICNEGSER